MADLIGGIPFGVDDLKVSARTAGGALAATKQDIFGATEISAAVDSKVEEARGDNLGVRKSRSGKKVAGTVKMLQHDPAILAIVGEGATSAAGVSPNTITSYLEPEAPGQKTYQIEAQSFDGLSATRLTIFNASTIKGPNFNWKTDGYSEPSFDYEGSGLLNGGIVALYKVEVFATGVVLGTTNP
ncbi:MAG: hypothetical protein ACR2M1_10540 [Gemmatimonadaceae bacterium]